MKYLLTVIFCLLLSISYSQIDSNCVFPIGPGLDNDCQLSSFPDTIPPNTFSTQCFTYTPTDSCFTLSYLLVNGVLCGPQQYSQLSFDIYNFQCDTLLSSGTIFPSSNNTWNCLGSGNFIICYTFKSKCSLVSGCPIINPSPLPVTWLYTKAIYSNDEKNIEVAWSTGSEINCNHYILQKYLFHEWKELFSLVCKGNSTTINTYHLTDEKPLKENIYRVKQVDHNNEITYSRVFEVKVNSTDVPCAFYNLLGNRIDESKLISGDYIKRCGETFTKIVILR